MADPVTDPNVDPDVDPNVDPNTTPEEDDGGSALAPPGAPENDGTIDNPNTVSDVTSGYNALGAAAGNADPSEQPGYVNPDDDIAELGVQGGEKYTTADTTVAGQLEKLLGHDSALQQNARSQARGQASALGMMSSSSAVGAARRGQMEVLSKIASQDAKTAAQFKQNEQLAENEIQTIQVEATVSGALTEQKASIAEKSTRIAQEWSALMAGMGAEEKAMLQNLQGGWQEKITTLDGEIKQTLQQMGIDAETEMAIINTAHESMNNYQISVQQMMSNMDFMDQFDGDMTKMENFFDDMFMTVSSSIQYSASAAGVYDVKNDAGEQVGLKGYIDTLVAANMWGDLPPAEGAVV